MFTEDFAMLPLQDQDRFRRITNLLLGRTFLLSQEYDFDSGLREINPDYRFVEANYSLFDEYLGYAGFSLHRDSSYGLIWITSDLEFNKVKLDKRTTQILYVLRLIYEEKRAELSLSREIFTSVGEIVAKMLTLQVCAKKPAGFALAASFRTLSRYRLIEKDEGKWDSAQTRLLIHPTVLFAVSIDQINHMAAIVDSADEATEKYAEKEENDEEADEAYDDSLV